MVARRAHRVGRDALYHHVYRAVHGSVDQFAESIEATGQKMAAVPLEAIIGPVALMMIHDGMRFALEHPAAARAYVTKMVEDSGITPADLAEDVEALQALEAAWRPLQ